MSATLEPLTLEPLKYNLNTLFTCLRGGAGKKDFNPIILNTEEHDHNIEHYIFDFAPGCDKDTTIDNGPITNFTNGTYGETIDNNRIDGRGINLKRASLVTALFFNNFIRFACPILINNPEDPADCAYDNAVYRNIMSRLSPVEQSDLLERIKNLIDSEKTNIWNNEADRISCPALLNDSNKIKINLLPKVITALIILAFRFQPAPNRKYKGNLQPALKNIKMRENPYGSNETGTTPEYLNTLLEWLGAKDEKDLIINTKWDNRKIIDRIVYEYLSFTEWFNADASENAKKFLECEKSRVNQINVTLSDKTYKTNLINNNGDDFYLDLKLKHERADKDKTVEKIKASELVKKVIEKKQKRVLVEGTAGQGKSTILKKLYLDLALNLGDTLHVKNPFPFFFSCKEIRNTELDLEDQSLADILAGVICNRRYSGTSNEQFAEIFKQAIEKAPENCVLFLDGLDEIPNDVAKILLEKLNSCNGAAIILSTRPDLPLNLSSFDKYTVEYLDDKLLGDYIERLRKIIGSEIIGKSKAESFLAAVKAKEEENSSYQNTSRVPFILGFVFQQYCNNGALPRNHIEALDTLIINVFRVDITTNRYGPNYDQRIRNRYSALMSIFANLALEQHKGKILDDNTINITIGKDHPNSVDEYRLFIQNNNLLFVHASFQDYFLAYGIYLDLSNSQEIDNNLLELAINTRILQYLLYFIGKYSKIELLDSVLSYALDFDYEIKTNPNNLIIPKNQNRYSLLTLICRAIEYIPNYNGNNNEIRISAKKFLLARLTQFDSKNLHQNNFDPKTSVNPYDDLFYYAIEYSDDEENEYAQACDNLLKSGNYPLDSLEYRLLEELSSILKGNYYEDTSEKYKDKLYPFSYDDDNYYDNRYLFSAFKIGLRYATVSHSLYRSSCIAIPSNFTKETQYLSYFDPFVIIQDGNPNYIFEDGLFYYKDNSGYTVLLHRNENSNIHFPDKLKRIAAFACGCNNDLIEINLPESLNAIEMFAFAYCTSLKTITIPDNVIYLSRHTFFQCSKLQSIKTPKSLKQIGPSAFAYCANLEKIDFSKSNNLEYIGLSAFTNCSKLQEITIPESVKEIGDYAFAYCPNLIVTLPENHENIIISESAFDGCLKIQYASSKNR